MTTRGKRGREIWKDFRDPSGTNNKTRKGYIAGDYKSGKVGKLIGENILQ